MINDIWGLKYDEQMAGVIAESGVACCLMHNRKDTAYTDYIKDIKDDLRESVRLAVGTGIDGDKIMIDPGVGFAKSYKQNLEIINKLEQLACFNLPVLLGCSRKSVIGLTLDLPANQRLEGTIATTVLGVMKGCSFVRVHDIKENVRAIRMTEAIVGR